MPRIVNSTLSPMRSALSIPVVLGMLSLLGACTAHAAVTDTTSLLKALALARHGAVIKLAPGTYAPMIQQFHGSVTITSADPSHLAVLTALKVTDSSGLAFDGLEFDATDYPIGPLGAAGTMPFQIIKSSNIILTHLDVHGSAHGTLATDEHGIFVRSSDHVLLSESDFHNLHSGFAHIDDTFLTIRNNKFHNLRDDSIRGGGSSNLLIDGNHCYDNHPDGIVDPDHPDCIQLWTANTVAPTHDVTITNNRYERGTGHAVQFIFLGNEKHIPYEHVRIADNVSLGSQWNGIRVIDAHDVTIEGNRITGLCAPDYGRAMTAWIATGAIDGLVMVRNFAGGYPTNGGNANVKDEHNSTTPCAR